MFTGPDQSETVLGFLIYMVIKLLSDACTSYETIVCRGRWGHLSTKFRKKFSQAYERHFFTTSCMKLKGIVFSIYEICLNHKIKSHF